jgi:hypothetical protein
MKRLHDYNQYIGKTVKATSANNYSEIKGKCINVRECVDDYTKGASGIRYLADIERAGDVKVGLASTMEIIEANSVTARRDGTILQHYDRP